MHFALPSRKTDNPPPFERASIPDPRRKRVLQLLSYAVLALLTLYLLTNVLSPTYRPDESSTSGEIPPDPDIVIVTVLDPSMSLSYIDMITKNRDDYAARHNYRTFYANTSTYSHLVSPSPQSWSLVPALRHALKLYPTANYFWSLTPHALITTPSLSLHSHIMTPLSQLMQKDIPIVPPDSVIHTYSHLKPSDAHLIMSQDMDNLAHTSFLLKSYPRVPNTTPYPDAGFAEYLLDSWFDPLYRTYAFHFADLHALEHLVQWHPTITAKAVLIPQRRFNSYNFATAPREFDAASTGEKEVKEHDSMWGEGDLVVNFKGCAESGERDCEGEMKGYYKRWEKEIERLDGPKKVSEPASTKTRRR